MFTRLVLKPHENTQHLVAVFDRDDVTKALIRRNILTPKAQGSEGVLEIEAVIHLFTEPLPDADHPTIPKDEAMFSENWVRCRGSLEDPEHVATVVDAALTLARVGALDNKE